MPIPPNTTSGTAIDFSGLLPYTTTQQVDFAGTTYTVWYKFTADVDGVIGIWGFGDLSVYRPTTRTRKINPTDPVYQQYQNRPTYFWVQAGTTYWFEVVPNAGNPTPANLTFSAELHQPQTVPIGSIAISDTVRTYPFALLSSADATDVLAYVFGPDYVSTEYGACILPDGTLCLCDSSEVVLYDADYTLIGFFPPSGGSDCYWVGSNNLDRFYVSSGWPFSVGAPKVFTIDAAGVLGPTTWTLPVGDVDVRGLAPSPDETILYYISQFFDDTNLPVKRWDLVNNVPLSDLAAGINANTYFTSNLLVLPDGSILVGYINDVASSQFVRRYSPAGAILNTYTIPYGHGGESDLLAHGVDYTTFWIWLHDGNMVNSDQRFLEIRVSDGTILKNLPAVAFDAGRYMYSETATPLARFGHSYSCPFWITRQAPGVVGAIRVDKVTAPPGLLDLFDFTAGGGLTPTSFQLADGQSQSFPSLTPGSGYSISEAPAPGFSTTYQVSNGSPIGNLSVAAGETVVVTVTNTQAAPPGGGSGCPAPDPDPVAGADGCANASNF